MKLRVALACILAMCLIVINCNACVTVKDASLESRLHKAFDTTEKRERELTEYIVSRTVRVIIRCVVTDMNGNIVRDKFDAGWGTGAIILSKGEYSLIQTANHVVKNEPIVAWGYKRVCDGFAIEQRDINNKLVSRFDGKIVVYATDKDADLAILRVSYNYGVSSKIAPEVYLGQSVRVVGFPSLRAIEGAHISYERGHVSTVNMGKNTFVKYAVRYGTTGFFGNSGGAIWNLRGEIVGTFTHMTGFSTDAGFIPQHGCVYGPGLRALIDFYTKYRVNEILSK